MTVVIQQEQEAARIPDWVRDLESFRRWAKSDEFPQRGWYAHLRGDLWVDSNMERLVHNQIKTEFVIVLGGMARQLGSGRYIGDRMLLTNVQAELSTEPDGMFVSHEAIRQGRVRLVSGVDSLEMIGSPEMVLEVVSPTSVEKDTMILRDLYFRASVAEYWLIDPRHDDCTFDILKRSSRSFTVTRKQGDWVPSKVFGKSFRLSRHSDPNGHPLYTLEAR